MKKKYCFFFLLVSIESLFALQVYAAPDIQPQLNSTAAVLLDADTGTVLYSKKGNLEIPPASMTKLMTLHLVYNALYKGVLTKKQIITVGPEADFRSLPPHSSLMFLEKGQRVSVLDLMRGLAVPSGNDAAIALAEAVAGSVPAFVRKMNAEAERLGFHTMHFYDASGLSSKNRVTAGEFAAFCVYYVHTHPEALTELHSLRSFTYPKKKNLPPGGTSAYGPITQRNRNNLLGVYSWADGLKTGYIDESGYNIAVTAQKDGRRLVAVLMGGPGKNAGEGSFIRAVDAVNLISYGFYRFTDYSIDVGKLKPVRVYGGSSRLLPLAHSAIKKLTIPRELKDEITLSLEIPHPVVAPVSAKTEIGTLHLQVQGKDIESYPVTAGKSIGKGPFWERFIDRIRLFLVKPVRCRKVGS